MPFIKNHARFFKGAALTGVFAFAAAGAAALALMRRVWGPVSMEQILFHLNVPLTGGVDANLRRLIFAAAAGAATVTALYGLFCGFCLRRGRRGAGLLAALALAGFALYAERSVGVAGFVLRQFQTTALFDAVPEPQDARWSFPGAKRNLLVIHMESMEDTFNDAAVMGAPLLPELARLRKEHLHFKGFRQVRGTTWTTAGVTASDFGLPLLLPIGHNDYGDYESFLPGALSIFEVLERSGYALEFMFSSDCSFGGIENLIRTHAARPVVKDLRWFSQYRSDVEQNRGNGWGLRDRYLYERLKEDLALRAASGAPYAFFVETLDTHGPDTYYFLDPDVRPETRWHDFRDVIRAGSLMMGEFIDWVQAQPFARDLTIVVLGDHLWMGDTVAGRPLGDGRAVFNLFINAIPRPERGIERLFSAPDFAPTILEAIGASLPGRRFGIGTSLFSGRPTMIEELGEKAYVAELGKTSARYNRFFKRPEGKPDRRAPLKTNDFSAGAPRLALSEPELFMRTGGSGAFQCAVFNSSDSLLSGAGDSPLRIRASVCAADGRNMPEYARTFPLPRDLPPQDAEYLQAAIPVPPEGTYRLRLEFVDEKDRPLAAAFETPLRTAAQWRYAAEDGGVPQDERIVLDGGAPCVAFAGAMEVCCHRDTLFCKLLDGRLSAKDLILRARRGGETVELTPRELRRASDQKFRWAAAPLDGAGLEYLEAGWRRGGAENVRPFSLLPAAKSAPLREEQDFYAYARKLSRSKALILAAVNAPEQKPGLLAMRDGQILTLQRGVPGTALHFDGEEGGVYLDLNTYDEATAAQSRTRARLSIRVNGLEYACAQQGTNFVVFDPACGEALDRAACATPIPLAELAALLAGAQPETARRTGGEAPKLLHCPVDHRVPIEKGAFLASWPGGPYVARSGGRLYFQTPWEQVFKIKLLGGSESAGIAPLDRAVSAGFDGVISALPARGASADVGFIDGQGQKHAQSVDLTPLFLETDFCRYLRRLANPDHVVLISVLDEGARRLTETHRKLFAPLGLDLSLSGKRRWSYAAVSDGGKKVYEECAPGRIDITIDAAGLKIGLVSTGMEAGYESSIRIDGAEYSTQSLGMNIVVYDKKQKRVVDSVAFNTYADLSASRKDPAFKR
ncbi:hypothetical protein RAH42_07290 [Pyramidobacter sp. YE332]|uniref:hypothetical protein n=1 Tax=Pyramidobacter sp. YE332 TaxID=3068894 RepID=UPI00294B26FC|nr:hypothetical protein [Pyramidobacter sp. YE332]WOL38966.1 hypothetical protein RAH42_07290 [Pyramidobacter sp. YE332]